MLGPRLVVVSGPLEGASIRLRRARPAVLGRSSRCDLSLSCDRISRRHAQVTWDGDQVRLEDLGSMAGTRRNGDVVTTCQLRDGDVIELGSVEVRLELTADAWPTPVPSPRVPSPAADAAEAEAPPSDPPASASHDPPPPAEAKAPTAPTAAPSPEVQVEEGAGDPSQRLLETLTDLLAQDEAAADVLLDRMLAGLLKAFQADRGVLFLPDGNALVAARRKARPGTPLGEDVPISRNLVTQAAQQPGPTLLTTEAADELRSSVQSLPGLTRSVLAAPFPHSGGVGVLYLDSVHERRAFLPGEGELLLAFARAAGLCLARDTERRQTRRRESQVAALRRRQHEDRILVGDSSAMVCLREEIDQVAPSPVTVLVTGESGTGKELAAQALHARSARAEGPFVAVNCAAIPRDLLESELFGHEKGAFSGAAERRLGRFELADGGTLFLDEVGELPLEAQGKLLRVLQERMVQRVGGARPHPVDFRLVCATNVDLEAAVAAGEFREDLFYRLAVYRLKMPPLRARGEDVVALAEHFLRRLAAEMRKPCAGFDEAALDALRAHDWPGNVRELRNVVEQAVVRARGPRVELGAVAPALEWRAAEAPTLAPPLPVTPAEDSWFEGLPVELEEARRRFERRFLEAALRRTGAVMKATAEEVGLSRRGLYDKCDELGIDYKALRGAGDEG